MYKRIRTPESLREQAEALLKQLTSTENLPPDIFTVSIDGLIHEIRVYYTEVQMQFEELQETNARLDATTQRYASLFKFAPVGYIITDPQGKILEANEMASRLLGADLAASKNALFGDWIASEDQDTYHLHRRAVLHKREDQHCEVQIRRPDGTTFDARLSTHLHDDHAETLRSAIINISTLKQAQEALRNALAHEMALNALRERILAVISHEFRTPLATILSSVELLESFGDQLSADERRQHYDKIRRLVWRLNTVVEEARAAGASGDDRPPLNATSFDVIAHTRQIIDDMGLPTAKGRQVDLRIDAPSSAETVTWDRALYERILTNLLSNAFKFSEDDVIGYLRCQEATIQIQVQDRGVGIPPEEQAHIFEAFYRGRNAEFVPGVGIGLFTVQRAVQAHGGEITCASAPGKGTTFSLDMPRHAAADPE
ncbi:MAG: PAS domain S-box protein [Chloroflexi bacterium]|nr:PAS domain S-box protein [Chloroflexota bacterium]